MGLNPAWRNSLAYTTIGTSWDDGANSTVIEAAQERLIENMRILEGIAPDSGAYLNEVRAGFPRSIRDAPTQVLFLPLFRFV